MLVPYPNLRSIFRKIHYHFKTSTRDALNP
jgi:hypothetical protein